MSTRTLAFVCVAMFGLGTAPDALGQSLGSTEFPTSGAAAAQPDFIRGVLLLHNFEYEDAATAFRAARRIDPSMAMAYWGEAMTYNHPVWMEQDRDAALEVLGRLAPTPERRAEKAPTQREKDFLATVEILYGDGPKEERDFRYRDAMRRLAETYPGDDDAVTLYALSILGTAHEGRDFATYMRAAAVAQPVFQRSPSHPGAAHYVIHAFDDPVHGPLGLPAARAYSQIAPDAGHAQHMTSHIFVAMGLWDDVVSANILARDVQNRGLASKGQRPNVCGHYTSWLQYGFLQQGRLDAAEATMKECHRRMADSPTRAEAGYFVDMRNRAAIDAGDWEAPDRFAADISAFPGLGLRYAFADALAALRRGDPATAQAIREELGSPEDARSPRGRILLLSLDGLLALARDDHEAGKRSLVAAAELEETQPYAFGPPATPMPPHELIAAELANLGLHETARAYWEEQLARTPQRSASLLGLARSAESLGDSAAAREAYRSLALVWHEADRTVDGLAEVRSASGSR